MNHLSDFCFLCFEYRENLKNIMSQDNNGVTLQAKLYWVLPEYALLKSNMPQYVCANCIDNLNAVYIFKQRCLSNIATINEYVQKLTEIHGPNKYLSIKLADVLRHKESVMIREYREYYMNRNSYFQINSEYSNEKRCHNYETEDNNLLLGNQRQNKCELGQIENIVIKNENNEKISENMVEEYIIKENLSCETEIEDIVIKQEPEDTSYCTNKPNFDNLEKEDSKNDPKPFRKRKPYRLQKDPDEENKKIHQCPLCPRKFRDRCDLAVHSRIHSGERPYVCQTCQKSFTTSGSLNRHKFTHTGVKPHCCDVCHRRFSDLSNLNVHKRIHGNLRPFKCSRCCKAFRDNRCLSKHMSTHSQKVLKCEFCRFECVGKPSLKAHLRLHKGAKGLEESCDQVGPSEPSCL